MLEYLNQVLASKGNVLQIRLRVGSGKFETANLIAADEIGVALVNEDNESIIVPWNSIQVINLGDISG